MSSQGFTKLSPDEKPLLIVLSGLSGAGKDAVLAGLRETDLPLEFIVTMTTRSRRAVEKDGVHYRFVSEKEFRQLLERGEMLESAQVYGNWYGVPKDPVRQALEKGKDIVVKVDVQGAATIKKILPQAVFIFLVPPSIEDLVERLNRRCTETPEEMEMRIKSAGEELKQMSLFDYIVVNRQGEIAHAIADIKAIITAEKCKVKPRQLAL
jgi:guanylate kinase